MYNVKTEKFVNVAVMDPIIRQVLGEAVAGMSSGPNGSVIHLYNDDPQNVAIAEAAFAGYWMLEVLSDKQAIVANDTDTVTITCSDPQLATVTSVRYHVLFDGELYAEGEAPLENGGITLELTSALTGRYIVIIWSDVNYKSGAVIVEAVKDGN